VDCTIFVNTNMEQIRKRSKNYFDSIGPVRLDPSTGNISWTGIDDGKSIIYFNGKVFLATGGNTLVEYDATTGNRLN